MKPITHRFKAENLVIAVTVFAIFTGLLLPKYMVTPHLMLFGFSLILAGVPHGASDFYLSRRLSKAHGGRLHPIVFLLGYVLLMVVYLIVWWGLPQVAFWIFILLSAYHFGQSNWSRISFPSKIFEKSTFLFWGLAVLGVPILLHFDQASTIVSEMTGSPLVLTVNSRAALVFLFIFGVIGNSLFLHQSGSLSKEQLVKELCNFLLLMLLFFTTPLLVGFGIYFVLWHSLGAISDQLKVVRATDPSFGYKAYLRSTVPFSLMAFAGLGMFYYFFHSFFDKGQNLGALFIFVSVITVPHAVLMDWLYQIGKPVLLEQTPQINTNFQSQELLNLKAIKN